MTDKQSNQRDMYGVVIDLYLAHQPVIDTVPARVTGFATLQGNVASIDSTLAIQTLVTAGVTADKKQTRAALNDLSFVIFGIARAWAIANDDNTNAEEFNFSLTDIGRIKDDSIIPFLTHRQTIVNANAVALVDYGITSDILNTWNNIMTAYATAIPAPRAAIVTISVSTAQLKTLFNATQKLLKVTIDPLMRLFKGTNEELYDLYVSSRIIIDRHGQANNVNSVSGTITNSMGQPVAGVIVILGSGPDAIQVETDSTGWFDIEFPSPQETIQATLTVQYPIYIPQERIITIVPKEDLTEDFQLQPVTPDPLPPSPPAP